MPLYDYRCKKCKGAFEELVRSPAEEKDVRCAHCGSARVERQLSTFALGRGTRATAGAGAASSSGCHGGSCGTCRSRRCH